MAPVSSATIAVAVATALVVLTALTPTAVDASPGTCEYGCAEGYFFSNCTGSCVRCSPGFFCEGNLTMPAPCPAGSYSTAEGNSAETDCIACGPGTFSKAGATSCAVCPPMTYSTGSVSACTSCPDGEVPTITRDACQPCALGTYADETTNQCEPCASGFACPSRTHDMEEACPAGTYSDLGMGYCAGCEPGFACPATSLQCVDNATSRNKFACPPGTYSVENQTGCTACPVMHYCPETTSDIAIPCPAGFYSMGGAVNCSLCPDGFICPEDSVTGHPLICSTVGNTAASRTECSPCPAGFQCPSPSVKLLCPLGTFSAEGATVCTHCPPGSACPSPAMSPVTCPVGTYSPGGVISHCIACNSTGALAFYQNVSGQTHCEICPAGYACRNTHDDPVPCARGFSSNPGARYCTHCSQLVQGMATFTPAIGHPQCVLCTAGHYCKNPAVDPLPCPGGTFSGVGAFNCTICPAGFHCPTAEANPVPCGNGTFSVGGQAECQLCPVNYQCPAVNRPPILCDVQNGFYSPLGDSQCYLCPSGTSCAFDPSAGNFTFAVCEPGTYRLMGSTQCKLCPPGFMCPFSDFAPIRCPEGMFSLPGSTSCSICPAGYACINVTAPVVCALGHYSFAGDRECSPCPPGYRCPNPWTPPILCLPGSFAEGSATNCTVCPRGWECPSMTRFLGVARECSKGWFSVGGQTTCTPCPGGRFCPSIFHAISHPCAPGHFSHSGQNNCTRCPPGWACPQPNREISAPFPCEGGTFSTGAQTACTVCPPGFACPFTDRDVMNICRNGTFTEPGERSCVVCAVGHYCPLTAVQPAQPMFGVLGVGRQVPCPPGEYAPAGSFQCFRCPKGFYCTSTTASDGGRQTCAAGFMTARGSQYVEFGATGCIACPIGMECPIPGEPARVCSPGMYAVNGVCYTCPAGFFCPTTVSTPTPCPAGTFSYNNSVACKPCFAGFLCAIQSVTPTPSDRPCPVGSYCPSGSTVPILCPAGTYGKATHGKSVDQACADCHAGFFCPAGTAGLSAMNSCPEGSYCPPGSPFPTPCPSGTYSNDVSATTRAVCTLCPEGYFCPAGTPRFAANPCPPGFYCPPGTGSGFENGCPAGTYSAEYKLTSAAQCYQCPPGHQCPTVGLTAAVPCAPGAYQPDPGASFCRPCEPGFACTLSGMVTSHATPCDPGHFCPSGSAMPSANPCRPGTYTFKTNLASAEQCEVCWRGYACPSGTGRSPTPLPLQCAMGSYCPGVEPPGNGKYYYAGSYTGPTTGVPNQFPCPEGTYTSSTDLFAPEQCTDCPAGQFCPGGGAAPAGPCAAGYFCPRRSFLEQQVACPAGTYNPLTGQQRQGDCRPCLPGRYCLEGSSAMQLCPMGSYSPFNKTRGAGPSGDVDSGMCLLCPGGYFCPEGSTNPIECEPGTYSAPGSGACSVCEGGRYCPQRATSADQKERLFLCPAGLLCPPALSRIPSAEYDACPRGHYCPLGTSSPVPCVPGTFNPHVGRSSLTECLSCTRGFFCSVSGAANVTGECAPGFYCPSGSTTATQEPCPTRYYRSMPRGESEDFCSVCPRGFFCPEATATPIPCTRGYYCIAGTDQPQPCPIGTFGNATNLRSQDECSACTAGYYCDGLGLAHPTGLCDPGYFCIGRAFTSAPPGLPTGGLCPKGGYCPPGSSFPTACAEGTFNNFTGGSTQQDCTACTPGFYCSGSNLPFPTGPCSAGYYCTGGAALPTQFRTPAGHFSLPGSPAPEECPLGTFNPSPAQGACTACIAGFYCPTRAMVTYLPCPPGAYCRPASVLPRPCPAGYFQPETMRQNISNCLPCSPGFYCEDQNLAAVSGPCVAGYYCRRACITSTCGRYSSNFEPIDNLLPNPGVANAIGGACPFGHYCPNGTANPLACPSGTIRDSLLGITREEDCHPCPARYFCPVDGQSTLLLDNRPQLCTPGYYCPGRISPTEYRGCSDSTCSTHMGEVCTLPHVGCDGEINENLKSAGVRRCPLGFHCPIGSDFPIMCGYLGNQSTFAGRTGMTLCEMCPRGYWCDNTVLLSIQQPQDCPPGRYCPRGTNRNQPMCPRGSWSDRKNLENITQCVLCPAGRYCPDNGLEDIGTSKMPFCFGGYYCTSGARSGSGELGVLGGIGGPCPVGHYCPNGTTHNISFACPPGTYKPTILGSSVSSCLPCDPGMYCRGSGLSAPSGPCAHGFYCPRGCSDPQCTNKQCAAGIDPHEPLRSGGPCPRGYYCPQNPFLGIGAILPLACPEGSFADVPALASCKDCPPGHHCGVAQVHPAECGRGNYCPPKTPRSDVPRCPPGSYNDWPRAHNITECNLCPAGRFCPYSAMNTSWGYCEPGWFCTAGATDVTGTLGILGGISGPCPVGHYCPRGTKANVSFPCPPGTYNPVEGGRNVTACVACRPGFYCEGWGLFEVTGPCAAGYYCPTLCEDAQCSNKPCRGNCAHPTPYDHGNQYAAGGICPSGHYCPQVMRHDGLHGATAPIMCVAGTYAPDSGMDACVVCPAGAWCGVRERRPQRCPSGHYCPEGTESPTQFPCPKGSFLPTYNNSNISACVLCSAGQFCDEEGLNITSGFCLAGYFCTSGSATPDAQVGILGGVAGPCPIGHYCPQGTESAVQFPCHPSTYQPYEFRTNRSACLPCTPGFYCPNFAQTAATDKCAQGYYCPRACADAYCSNKVCMGNCNNPYLEGGECPSGYICPGTAIRGTVFPEACPAGTYSPNTGRYYCLNCPPGHYCAPATSVPKPCPLGRYCPVGTTQDMPRCPPGSFNDATHGRNLTDCSPCRAGRYCQVSGNSSYTDLCFAGYYCVRGAIDGRGRSGPLGGEGGICPPGYYCPRGTEHPYQFPCPPGTYQPRFGATNASQCIACTPGYFCERSGQRNVTSHCESGFYCPRGCIDAKCSNAWPCRGNCSLRLGGACPLGHFCPLKTVVFPVVTQRGVTNVEGSVTPIPCPLGQYQGAIGQDHCEVCPPGHYCLQGSETRPRPIPCPAGGYCPQGTAAIIPQCPEGSYSNRVGLNSSSECYRCAAGRFCDSKGMTAPGEECAKGYFCSSGARDPFGRVGLLGGVETPFPRDPLGAQICPAGHYCPRGSTSPIKCPPGTYNPHPGGWNETESCIACDGGFYCQDAGLLSPTGPCIGGYYCPRGCVDRRCYHHACAGLPGGDCPTGFFCPNGTATPFPCPAGTTASVKNAVICPACPAGFYCPQGTSDPLVCPHGRFCPHGTGSVIPMCPVGSFSNLTGRTNASDCARCSGGAACTTPGLMAPNEWCEQGHFCTSGAKSTHGDVGPLGGIGGPCPPGYYCPPRTAHAQPCPEGTYNPDYQGVALASCLACMPGKYCASTALSTWTGDCDPGFYCTGSNVAPNPPSGVCTAGHFCPGGNAAPLPCPGGTFNVGVQATSIAACLPCPQGRYCLAATATEGTGDCTGGWYCSGGSNQSRPVFNGGYCVPGYYCPPASTAMRPCPAGKYCGTTHLWWPTGGCQGGYYCLERSTTATPTDGIQGDRCPPGNYCPSNASKPFPCPAGTFNPHDRQSSSAACVPCTAGLYCPEHGQRNATLECDAGYYCPPGQSLPNPSSFVCPRGFFCPRGSKLPIRCHSGYFQDEVGATECKPCPEGYFCNQKDLCPTTNYTTPRLCPEGYFCPNGTQYATQFPCPNGTYSNATGLIDEAGCTPCDGGRYCDRPAMDGAGSLCSAGFFCVSGASTPRPRDGVTGNICPRGFYCEEGTTHPLPCPTSTYGAREGLRSMDQCTTCTPGFYCSGLNLTEVSGPCAPGFYCPGGQSVPDPAEYLCPYGQHCPGRTATWLRCPSGSFATGTGQVECQPCSAGRYCDSHFPCSQCLQQPCVGNYTCERSCPLGYFCLNATRYATQFPCPAGRYGTAPDLTEVAACIACPAGQYCPERGMSQLVARLCAPGYHCKSGASVARPTDGVTGEECPRGQYCPRGTTSPFDCPAGTFNPALRATNITACGRCRPGWACTQPGLAEPDLACAPGFYCPGGQLTATPAEYTCPRGFFCQGGNEHPRTCPMGQWSDSTGQTECDLCPAGHYCNQREQCPQGNFTMPRLCPPGHYCPPGTQYARQFPCPIGTFSTEHGLMSASNCTLCPGGSACDEPGMTTELSTCAAGHYCFSGAFSRTPNDGNVTGDICPPGHYCPEGTKDPIGCPIGTFSNLSGLFAADQCWGCTPGKYCAVPGLIEPTDDCDAQTYCPGNQSTAQGIDCPQFKHCPRGSAAPQNCPNGTYVIVGVTRRATCYPCPPGRFCNLLIQQQYGVAPDHVVPVACPRGHYCPEGTEYDTQYPCPTGTFSNISSLQSADECTLCLSGRFCTLPGIIQPTGICEAGYYCARGSNSSRPRPPEVPPSRGGPCPPGRFCHFGSGEERGTACPPGTFFGGSGATNRTWCMRCRPGFFCPSPGSTSDIQGGPCSPGYYCPGGNRAAANPELICPRGHFCVQGTPHPVPCPGGTYNPVPGQTSCGECPEYHFCPRGSVNPVICFARHACPAGSAYPIVCPNGTYAAVRTSAMRSISECALCPAGAYCTNGTVTGPCAAGFWCEYGNSIPEPSAETDIPGVKKGGECPLGYYCPSGTPIKLPCTNQTVGARTGLQRPEDCQPCAPGFYCLENSIFQIECPPGHYCPGFVGRSLGLIPCPVGTFNPERLGSDISFCRPCRAGYYCPVQGLSTTFLYPTPGGYYSSVGQAAPYPCPGGTYQPRTNGTAIDTAACMECPVGHFCGPEASTWNHTCPEGTFCPPGSTYPFHCPGGFYCPRRALNPVECPMGFYCPPLSVAPVLCWNGTYCPPRTEVPLLCPNGYVSRNDTALRIDMGESCQPCDPGTWSTNTLYCELCGAGHVCLGATTTATPTNITTHRGYECPIGHFCPAGSSAPTPCPPGRFNNETGGRTISACFLCPSDFYNPDFGMSTCRRCGRSAQSEPGSPKCDCIGRFRSFQAGDNSCRCIPGYIFYTDGQQLSEDDSELPCQPRIFDRCPAGQVRSSIGRCVDMRSEEQCNFCPDRRGRLDPQVGVCTCDAIQTQEETCDDRCLRESSKMFIDTAVGQLIHFNPRTGEEVRVDLDASGILGTRGCANGRANCEVKMVRLGDEGTLGVFDPDPVALIRATTAPQSSPIAAAAGLGSRRFEQQQALNSTLIERTLANPVVCLNFGDAMIWDVSHPSRRHFPVYQKDNLLNTNPDFDYTEFRVLAENIRSPNLTISTFMFTFSEPGVYVFNDDANFWSITVIRVVSINEVCPPSPFAPITEGSLLSLGVRRNTELLLAPDWILIGVLMAGLFCLVAGTIGGLWHFRRQTWGVVGTALPRYRNLGMQALTSGTFATLASKGTNTHKAQLLATGEERASAPPGSSRVMTLRLDTPMKDFVPSEFVEIVAKEAGVQGHNVLILSVTEGSTIVRFVITGLDDSQGAANLLVNRIADPTNDIRTKLPILAYEEEEGSDSKHPAFSMAELEDEFWDYERQIDLEGFNVRTLYDKLEDQTIHLVSQLANQKDDVLLLCDKILVESETLKDMFLKIKMDIDERTKKEKELQETRDAKLSTGQIDFDLPEDLKHVLAKFLEEFFQKNIGGLLSQANLQGAVSSSTSHTTSTTYNQRGGDEPQTSTTDRFGQQEQQAAGGPARRPKSPDGPIPDDLENVDAFKDMFGKTQGSEAMKAAMGLARKRSISGRPVRRATRVDSIPPELLDDSDQDEDERLRRGAQREEFVARRLQRVRRTVDRVIMPTGLEDLDPADGTITAEEAARRKKERDEWKAARRAERQQQDQVPAALRDDPNLPMAVRLSRQQAREEHLARRLTRLRDVAAAVDIPANLVDDPKLSAEERAVRQVKRDNFVRQKIEKARKVRAETMVPMELDDDSDADPAQRQEMRDKRGDIAAEILIKNPNAPVLPPADEEGLAAAEREKRRRAQDETVTHRVAEARVGLRNADVAKGLSDNSDEDDKTRDQKRDKRDSGASSASSSMSGAAARRGPGGKSKSRTLADSRSGLFVAKQDFSVLDVAKIPNEFRDDSDLDDDDREVRRELRHAFKAGRAANVGDTTLPENEKERNISEKERQRRHEINEAFRRGRDSKAVSVSTHASLKTAKRVIGEAQELAEDDEAKRFVELGKQQERMAVMPGEYVGADERKQKLQLAFNQGRKAASVAALPQELEETPGEPAKKQELRNAFLQGKSAAESASGLPQELEDSAQLPEPERERRARLRDAFVAGRAASQAASFPEELESGESDAAHKKELNRAFEQGRHAAKKKQDGTNVIPVELRDDIPLLEQEEVTRRRKLQAVFMQGYRAQAAEQMIKELDASGELTAADKKAIRAAFEQGSNAQSTADALPAELVDNAELTAAEREAVAKKRAAFLKGRAAAKMGAQFVGELLESSDPHAERKKVQEAIQRGANAHHAMSEVPEELRDAKDLTPAERERRKKLRRAFEVGKQVRVAGELPEELPVDEEAADEQPQSSGTLARRGSRRGEGAKRGVQFRDEDPALAAAAGRADAADAADAADPAVSAEVEAELRRAKKEHHQAYKELKKKQAATMSIVMEELEDEAVKNSRSLDESLSDTFLRERKDLEERHAEELLHAKDKDAIKKKHLHELQELKRSQDEEQRAAQEHLVKRAAEKKQKMKSILDQRHMNELRLQKTLQVNQEEEIKRLKADAAASASLGDALREEDLKRQKDALLEKLKMRERRQKAKAVKEKELLEAELRATEALERESLETEVREKKEQLLKRARASKTNPKELEEESARIEKLCALELESSAAKLNSRLEAERYSRERELADRQAAEKERELRAAQGEVDKLLEAKRKLQAQQDATEHDGHGSQTGADGAKGGDAIPAAARNAVELLLQQQQARKKLQEDLAKQREEEAKKVAADDVAAKQEAAKEIARRERERGEKLSEQQKREIFEECRRNQSKLDDALTHEQRKQQEEAKKRLEERRRKKEAELAKQQLEAMQAELRRQEEEQRKKEAELNTRIAVKPGAVEVAPEIAAEEEEMQRRAHRMKEDLRKKHDEEQRQLEQKLEEELKKQQERELAKIRAEHQRKKMELMSQQTAQESMQMPEEEKQRIMEQHEAESRKLTEALEREAAAQKAKLQEQLEARKRKKKTELAERQRQEALTTEKKADEERETFVRTEMLKAEKKIIDETVGKNKGKGTDAQDVAQVVMSERHRNEVQSLAARQQRRRLEEQDAREALLRDDREDLQRRMNAKIDAELLNITADDPNRDAKAEQIRAKAAKLLAVKMRELEERHEGETQATMDTLEMQFAEEQLQLKLQQWNEVATAAGMVAPEEALARYQQKAALRAADDAEKELLAFRESKQAEQDMLSTKLAKEKEEYEAKMKEQYNKLQREQEEDFKKREAAMQEELAKRKAKMEAQLREARRAAVAPGQAASGSGPSAQESVAITKRLMEEVKEDERRMKEQLQREKEKQDAELRELLEKKREKKRQLALRKAEQQGDALEQSARSTTNTTTTSDGDGGSGGGATQPAPAPLAASLADEVAQAARTVGVSGSSGGGGSSGGVVVSGSSAGSPSAAGGVMTLDPASHQQWVTAVVQQLTHSPIMEKLVKIERMMAGQVRHGLLSYYLDAKDRQIRANEGKLEAMELSELSTTEFVVYCFAASVKENITRAGIKLPPVKVAVAKSLPDANSNNSAFRNSYAYDHGRRTLYIRNTRLANLGEFVVVMIHGLAHIKAAMTEERQHFGAWNDADPAFLAEFYGLLEVCTEEMFYMRLPSSQAHRDVKEGRGYRPDAIMSRESLAAMEDQLRTIGKANREGFLKTYLMM